MHTNARVYQRSRTWDRRYQKAIREPIHLAHSRVARSRQLYGHKSHSAVSRQDNYCSRAASRPVSQPVHSALLSKTNAPRRPTITPAALTSIISQWLFLLTVHVRLHTKHWRQASDFGADAARASDSMLRFQPFLL